MRAAIGLGDRAAEIQWVCANAACKSTVVDLLVAHPPHSRSHSQSDLLRNTYALPLEVQVRGILRGVHYNVRLHVGTTSTWVLFFGSARLPYSVPRTGELRKRKLSQWMLKS